MLTAIDIFTGIFRVIGVTRRVTIGRTRLRIIVILLLIVRLLIIILWLSIPIIPLRLTIVVLYGIIIVVMAGLGNGSITLLFQLVDPLFPSDFGRLLSCFTSLICCL